MFYCTLQQVENVFCIIVMPLQKLLLLHDKLLVNTYIANKR